LLRPVLSSPKTARYRSRSAEAGRSRSARISIWDAILWASDQVVACLHTELSIVVNGRNLGAELPPAEPQPRRGPGRRPWTLRPQRRRVRR
jgi:hypothetical protein